MPVTSKGGLDDQVSVNKRRLVDAEDARDLQSWMKAWGPSQDIGNKSAQHTKTDKAAANQNDGHGIAMVATSLQSDSDSGSDFSVDSDTGGLGFAKPKNDISTGNSLLDRQTMSSNDKLRRQLLGSKAAHLRSGGSRSAAISSSEHSTSTPRLGSAKLHQTVRSDSDDDESGKGRIFTAKSGSRKGKSAVPAAVNGGRTASSRKRAASYLDEMLAKRSKKGTRKSADLDD